MPDNGRTLTVLSGTLCPDRTGHTLLSVSVCPASVCPKDTATYTIAANGFSITLTCEHLLPA
jgi:hypothetical protein